MHNVFLGEKYKHKITSENYITVGYDFESEKFRIKNIETGEESTEYEEMFLTHYSLVVPPFLSPEELEAVIVISIILAILAGLIWYA